jgi:GNAT superfamily N-acetyltransferase
MGAIREPGRQPVLRNARSGEAATIASIHETTARVAFAHVFGRQPYPTEHTRERWRRFSGEVVLAELDGSVVGFAARDGDLLDALFVLPNFQGRGIGSALLSAFGPVSRLWVLKGTEAQRFYEARGWRPEGSEQTAFGATELLYVRPNVSTEQ